MYAYCLLSMRRQTSYYTGIQICICIFVQNVYTHVHGCKIEYFEVNYRKVPKFLDARKHCCHLHKIQTKRPNFRVFRQNDANGIANSEDPDQTAPLGAVISGSALFAHTCLSENLGSLRVL